ncbi:MAG: hypothetical protein GY700_06580 [Propionibacteriaceae bacterium]|nr:hypothetical protein [Propionibacteriaceae bacterium]
MSDTEPTCHNVVRVTFDMIWTSVGPMEPHMVEFMLNESSLCLEDVIQRWIEPIFEANEDGGCSLCSRAKAEFLRYADPEEEESGLPGPTYGKPL